MKRPLPIAASVFGAGALALSFLILPGEHEIAAMDVRDASFQSAIQNYEAAWSAGDRSEATLAQLARAYIGAGEVDRAVNAFQEFLAREPGHGQAKAALLETYLDGQRTDEHYALLVDAALDGRDAVRLRQAAEAARDRQEGAVEARLLARLIDIEKASPDQIRRRAWLAARAGDYKSALALLDALPSGRRTWQDRDFAFRLALDMGDTPAALAIARQAVAEEGGVDALAIYVSVLNDYGARDAARTLIQEVKPGADPADRLAYADLLLAVGDANGAIALARQAGAEARDEETRQTAVRLLVDAGDAETLAALAGSPDFASLNPEQQAAVIDALADKGDDPAAAAALAAAHPATSATYPALAARIALQTGDRRRARQLVRAALASGAIAPATAVELAATAEALGDKASVRKALAAFPAPLEATPDVLEAMAGFHARNGDAAAVLPAFAEARQAKPSAAADRAWARLAARAGDGEAVARWIEAQPDAAKPALAEIAAAALARRDYSLARIAAEKQAEAAPTRANQSFLAYVRHQTGDPRGALAILDGLGALTPEEQGLYAAAAIRSGDPGRIAKAYGGDVNQGGARAAEALHALLAAGAFAKTEAELARRIAAGEVDWLYAYGAAAKRRGAEARFQRFVDQVAFSSDAALNAGITALRDAVGLEASLALQAKAAQRLGGKWAEAHEYALEQAGRAAQANQSRRARASQGGQKERIAIADALVGSGDRVGAETVLRDIAAKAGAYSEAADRLGFLWGPRAPREALAWVEAQARQAKAPEERAKWHRRLSEIGGERPAFRRIASLGRDAVDAEARLAADLATAIRDDRAGAAGLARLVEGRRTARTLAALADAAETLGDHGTAFAARARAVRLAPQEPRYLRALGYSAGAIGRSRDQRDALTRYIALVPGDAQARMDLGYAAQAERDYAAAAQNFAAAAQTLARAGGDPLKAELAAAYALQMSGRPDDALQRLAALDRARPRDPRVRAAYVEALLNAGKPEEARRALNR